jgi:hypothetical protein
LHGGYGTHLLLLSRLLLVPRKEVLLQCVHQVLRTFFALLKHFQIRAPKNSNGQFTNRQQ